MSLASLFLALAPLDAPVHSGAGELGVDVEAPGMHVPGEPYVVRVELTARGAAAVPAWYLTSAAFEVDGRALGERALPALELPLDAGATLALTLDLAPSLALHARAEAPKDADADAPAVSASFVLTYAGAHPLAVDVFERAPAATDFTALAPAELARYAVLLRTNRGDMLFELWPDVAPKHVQNFLDLANAKFYDGTGFHRVMPGFMIQGGDPEGTGSGNGPRTLKAEFSAKSHERGVLSMARSGAPDSASCQFFVMHADGPQLDGQYSVFGKLLRGFDALDAIATAPGPYLSASGDVSPSVKQTIERAVVVLAKDERN